MKKGTSVLATHVLPVVCALFAMSFGISATANEIYTWTDENGVVHFSGTEPHETETETIEIEASRGGVSYSQPIAASEVLSDPEEAEPTLTAAQQRRQDIAQARQVQQEEQASIAQMCEMHRQQLEEMEPARRVYYTNEDGERVRMDDDERVTLIDESNRYIAENCH